MMDGLFMMILQESLGGYIRGDRESPPGRPWQSSMAETMKTCIALVRAERMDTSEKYLACEPSNIGI